MLRNNTLQERKSIRLKAYNYKNEGLYFITLCAEKRQAYFSTVVEGVLSLNCVGEMIEKEYLTLENRFPSIRLHEYVIMPNHMHFIVEIHTNDGISLGDVVGAFKSLTTYRYIENVKTNDWIRFDKRLWQRNYYEHVIRNDESYHTLLTYIANNPLQWKDDMFYDE